MRYKNSIRYSVLTALALGAILILNSFTTKNYRKFSEMKEQQEDSIDFKVDSLLTIMTLEEKVGQMNQYNGFWDVTGPSPEGGNAEKKYDDLRKGRVGSMLTVRGTDQVRAVQKIVVEESRSVH